MQSSTLSEWLEAEESDSPWSDGAWANAWVPVWEDAANARSVEMTVTAVPAGQPEGMAYNG